MHEGGVQNDDGHLLTICAQDDQTALMMASDRGYLEVVQDLLAAGANTEARNYVSMAEPRNWNEGGGILVHCGAKFGIDNSPVMICMQFGETALIRASRNGHPEVVKALLAAGANKAAKDKVGGRVRAGKGSRWGPLCARGSPG